MKNIFTKKTNFTSITFLSFFLATNVYGQEKFTEKNLPQTELKQVAKPKEDSKNLNSNNAKNLIKDSIDKIILQKKVSSLMFDDEESLNIKSAVELYKNESLDPEVRAKKLGEKNSANGDLSERGSANEKLNIYLNSILYFDSQNWVIWVNNQKITSRKNNKEEEIFAKKVTKEKVKLIWQMSLSKWKILSKTPEDSAETPPLNKDNKVEIEVELKQNQTYVLSKKKIFEGKIYTKPTKVEDKNSEIGNIIRAPEDDKNADAESAIKEPQNTDSANIAKKPEADKNADAANATKKLEENKNSNTETIIKKSEENKIPETSATQARRPE